MNIRPMDMQVLIPRATDVAKNQQISDQQGMQQQQQFAAEWKKIADVRQNQVQSSSKTEGEKVKAKEERQSHKRNQERAGDENQDAETDTLEDTVNHPSPDDPLRGHRIDIKM
jgi:hypothetical protein